ncbi:MAG: DUF1799 domain-containing protein [Candidatus Accumulibacter sp.]|uniref:DUF1799 domain-containing protein n=1 Tax=Accumulibacter sp. TaxID=2053492 RepID=UPI0025F702AD|nr:DUF1799 domain-containing protein [Accumulibacter sp.]MCM8599909.1 DUF1799 domain-containing protein [Accumulibacter sp.]MCM8664093.1 DUF1799 domain-containing protein [Accumulibacter sp.]
MPAFGVWKENVLPLEVFLALQTQWAVGGMGGVIGLRYEALPAVLDLLQIKKRRRRDLFAALRVLEAETLRELSQR